MQLTQDMALAFHQGRFIVASLTDLNNYASNGFVFNDNRAPAITYSNTNPTTQSVSVLEGYSHTVPDPTDISHIQATLVNYTVNVASLSGATVTWPAGAQNNITFSNPTPGVYTAGNIFSISQWNSVKGAVVHAPRDYDQNWSYSVSLTPNYGNAVSFTTNVSVTPTAELSNPTNIQYDKDVNVTLSGTPTIIDTETDGIYHMTVTPNNVSAVNSMSSLYSTFNNNTKVLSITGLNSQVISGLANIILSPNAAYTSDFTLTYQLTNPVSNVVTTKTQYLTNANITPNLSNVSQTRYYDKNTVAKVFSSNVPQITATTPTVYRVEVRLNSNVGFISGGNIASLEPNWYAGNLTYSVSGTKSSINSQLANLWFFPNKDTYTTSSISISEWEDGFSQGGVSFNLVGNNNSYSGEVITLSTNGATFNPTFEQAYYRNCDILLVGQGGFGSKALIDTYSTPYKGPRGGGGGAGQVVYLTNTNYFNANATTVTNYINHGGSRGYQVGLTAHSNDFSGQGATTLNPIYTGPQTLLAWNGGHALGGFDNGYNDSYLSGGQYYAHPPGVFQTGAGGWRGSMTGASDEYDNVHGGSGIQYSGGDYVQATSGNSNYNTGVYVPGGGAGSAGNGSSSATGTAIPGAGTTVSISGTAVTYARGGHDGLYNNGTPQPGDGGNGGVTDASMTTQIHATDGQPGIVIIRFY